MRILFVTIASLCITLLSQAQKIPCLKVTLTYDSVGKALKFFTYEDKPLLIEIENTGINSIQLLERLIINREEDDNGQSNIYLKAEIAEKNGWKPLKFIADVDIWEDPTVGVPVKRLKRGEKILLRWEPFTYFGDFSHGKNEYRIKCFYRIRQECGDIVYQSNDIRLFIQIP